MEVAIVVLSIAVLVLAAWLADVRRERERLENEVEALRQKPRLRPVPRDDRDLRS